MELEYKYTPKNEAEAWAILAALDEGRMQARVVSRHGIVMASQYYDTPSRALRAQGWSLRLRGENDVNVCCVKHTRAALPGALRLREEYECEAASIAEGLSLLREKGVPEEFFALCSEGTVPIARVHFVRAAYLLECGKARMELAFDRGYFGADPEKYPFTEIEIEYKSGEEADFRAFAEALSARFALAAQEKSKLARALLAEDQKG